MQVYDSARVPGDGVSSKIIDITDDGVTVQCIGGRILIKRVRPAGAGKVTAPEWAATAGLSVGDLLGS